MASAAWPLNDQATTDEPRCGGVRAQRVVQIDIFAGHGDWLSLGRGEGRDPRRSQLVQLETLVISLPQQQVGLAVPGQSGGALLVTVTSHPQAGSTQR